MIYTKKPERFNSAGVACGCFIECEGKILMLHNNKHKKEGNTWGHACGKSKKEETGITLDSPTYHGTLFVRYPNREIVYHHFHQKMDTFPEVILSEEHKDYAWLTPEEALKLPLMIDEGATIKWFYEIK